MLDVDKLHLSVQELTGSIAPTMKEAMVSAAQDCLLSFNDSSYFSNDYGSLLEYYRKPSQEVALFHIKPAEGYVFAYEMIGKVLGEQASKATHPDVFLKVVSDLCQNEDWQEIVREGLINHHQSLLSDNTYLPLVNKFKEGCKLADPNVREKISKMYHALRPKHFALKDQAKELVLSCDFLVPTLEEKLFSLCVLAEKFSCQSAPLSAQSPTPLSSEVLIQSKRLESSSQPSQGASHVQRP